MNMLSAAGGEEGKMQHSDQICIMLLQYNFIMYALKELEIIRKSSSHVWKKN